MASALQAHSLSDTRARVAVAAHATQSRNPEARGRKLRAHLHTRFGRAGRATERGRIIMGGLFGSLSIALSGIGASQQELETSSNNVANANTTGYSREVTDTAAGAPISLGSLSVGTGVVIEKIDSLRDPILEIQ